MIWKVTILVLLTGVFLTAAALFKAAFRYVVGCQYRVGSEQWEASGRPRGAAVPENELSFWTSDLAGFSLFFRCLGEAPEWIKDDAVGLRWLSRMRVRFWLMVGTMVLALLWSILVVG